MKIEIKKSGDKKTVKVTPERQEEVDRITNILGRPPDLAKGSKNPPHWHIPIKHK